MKNNLIALWLLVVLLSSYVIYDLTINTDSSTNLKEYKIGYIQLSKVFEEFDMKKDMTTKLESETSSLRSQMDSLAIDIQITSKSLEKSSSPELEASLQYKRVQYYNKRQEFEKLLAERTQLYDQKIIERLNTLVHDFANSNGYDFIYGADGSGFLMFGADAHDVSNNVIRYINNTYQGN